MDDILKQARQFLLSGKPEDALKTLSEISSDTCEDEYLMLKAESYFELGDFDEAAENAFQALKKAPENRAVTEFMDRIDSARRANPFLTLSMIVKNESENLPDCLKSVEAVVDEIVVTDTGSTDDTVKIAEQFGAKVYNYKWSDDFAAARNESLKHCRGKWVLYLDADEQLSPESVHGIRKMLKESSEDAGGFVCRIDNAHSLDDTGVMSGSYPRIFKNFGYPELHFFGRIHEQISPSVFDRGLSLYPSDIVIRHKGYNINREELRTKTKRNLQILSEHTIEEPENGYSWYQLGQTLAQMGIFNQSNEALTTAIRCGNLSPYVQSTTFLTLSNISRRKKEFSNALDYAQKALASARDKIPPLHAIAVAHLMLGNAEEAEELFEKINVLNKDPKTIRDYKLPLPQVAIDKGIQEARQMQGKPVDNN